MLFVQTMSPPSSRVHTDIRTLRELNGSMQWIPAPLDWAEAYTQYKMRPIYGPEVPFNHNNQFIVYREDNNCYMPTRIQRLDTGAICAIMDCSDVKVFLQDIEPVNWHPARNYQMWAFRDFMYDPARPVRKHYASKHSSYLFFQMGASTQTVVEIDIDGLQPNIIFSISRNDNGSVYYERNDAHSTRVRICEHEGARAGFRGFYARMTMVPGVIVSPPTSAVPIPSYTASSAIPLTLPLGTNVVKTNVEKEQCIMCYENKKNIKFAPCNHGVMCSECYTKLIKPRECPVCKQKVASLLPF